MDQKRIKGLYNTLGAAQVFVAIGAIPAGILFLADTSGALMGNSVEMLAKSPFRSFLIPGLFLVIVHGLFNVIGAVLSFRKHRYAAPLGLVLGLILMLWIIIQVWIITLSSFLQPLMFVVGLAEAILGLLVIRKKSI